MSATVYLVILLFSIFNITDASHFRGATFSWTPVEDGATIKIKFRISWRRDYNSGDHYWCDDSVISTGSLIGSENMACYSGCSGTIGFEGCCWIDSLKVGAGGSWSVLATVDLSVRSDTGRINSSPTAEMTPVLNLQDGCPYTISLQVGDVDGDIVRCRWAKGDIECDDVCDGLIGAVLDEEACSITYYPNGSHGLYAAALQIEDFASSVSTTPFTSVPMQFIVKVHSGGSCDDIPEFIQPTPDDSSCFALDVGDNMNVTVKARGLEIFNKITTLSAIGMVRSSEKIWNDSLWHYIEMNLTWTPTEDDAGQDHNLCFYATDSTGMTSQTRCINLPVSVSGPTPLRVERVGFSNTWTIIIDQTFTKPTEAAFIKVYESLTNTELISVDASTSSDVVFDAINRQINVSFNYDFDIEEDYHVTIPSGLVEGFVSCGALSVAVNDSGFWSIEVDCGKLTILNGDVSTPNGTDYPHSIFYKCNIGHDLVGVKKRTCTANGTWTEKDPFCNVKNCGNFSIPDNGFVSTNSTVYNTTVYFNCDEGYEISGNSSMYCEHTAVWGTSPPVCILVDCDSLLPPVNGTIDIDNTTVGNTVTYKCDVGFILQGYHLRECLHTALWSGSDPTCELADCGPLSNPANGSVSAATTFYGSIATYSCKTGFEMTGGSTITCETNGSWSGEPPYCQIKVCGFLQAPENGLVKASAATYQTIATFTCNVGFDLVGDATLKCTADGVWNGTAPYCKIKDCGSLSSPDNGAILTNETTFSSHGFYVCNSGFELIGVGNRTCLSNGTWSESAPSCKLKDCGSLLPPVNGTIDIDNTTVGNTVTYRCDVGFILQGYHLRECLHTALWSGSDPTCKLADCGPLSNPANGSVSAATTFYGSIATYSCKTGFEMTGGSTITCETNGSWSGEPPNCQIKVCEFLQAPENGLVKASAATYQTIATFTCNEGFDLVGDATLECTADGVWNGSAPYCKIKDCGSLSSPDNGVILINETTFSSHGFYVCNSGFELIGVDNRICLSNGSWSESAPSCKLKDCGSLLSPVNGTIDIDNTTVGNTATYTCDVGFILQGYHLRECLHTALWSGSDPTCELADCGPLSNPANGSVSAATTFYGSIATYSCKTGFEMTGGSTITCGTNGSWSGQPPYCQIKVCGFLQAPENGLVKASAATYQTIATFTCNEGFDLAGDATLECTADGVWNGSAPYCKIKDCGSLSSPDNGVILMNDTTFSSHGIYVCNSGFELIGVDNRTCLSNGTWSESAPSCELKDCGIPSPPQNGNISYENTTYGSGARYFCFTGYEMKGVELASCGADGFWNSTGQDCIAKGTNAYIMTYVIIGGVSCILVLVVVSIVIAVRVLRNRRKNTECQEPIELPTLTQL